MHSSEIVVPKLDIKPLEDEHNVKLRQAYLHERKTLENVEIELNRSKIVIIDKNGKILKLAVIVEH